MEKKVLKLLLEDYNLEDILKLMKFEIKKVNIENTKVGYIETITVQREVF